MRMTTKTVVIRINTMGMVSTSRVMRKLRKEDDIQRAPHKRREP
jgi:hypothetical protein